MKTHFLLSASLAAVCFCGILPAAAAPKTLSEPTQVLSSEKGGEWKQARTWEGKQVPSGFEIAVISRNAKVTVNSSVPPVNKVVIGDVKPKSPMLIIENGADLKVENFFVVWTSRTNSVALGELKGGSLAVGSPDYPEGRMIVGTGMTLSGAATFTFSGGKYTGGIGVGTTQDYHTGKVVIVGSVPKIESGKVGSNGLVVCLSGTIEFILDDKGVATLEYAEGRQVVFESGAQVVVDGKAYRGGSKTIPLITGPANKFTDNGARLSAINFPAGTTATLAIEPYRKGKALMLKIKGPGN